MHAYTKTETAIMDYLYNMAVKGYLPVTKESNDVEWIYTMRNGKEYGVTNAMAQTIRCISERCKENGEGGTLKYVGNAKKDKTFYIV